MTTQLIKALEEDNERLGGSRKTPKCSGLKKHLMCEQVQCAVLQVVLVCDFLDTHACAFIVRLSRTTLFFHAFGVITWTPKKYDKWPRLLTAKLHKFCIRSKTGEATTSSA